MKLSLPLSFRRMTLYSRMRAEGRMTGLPLFQLLLM